MSALCGKLQFKNKSRLGVKGKDVSRQRGIFLTMYCIPFSIEKLHYSCYYGLNLLKGAASGAFLAKNIMEWKLPLHALSIRYINLTHLVPSSLSLEWRNPTCSFALFIMSCAFRCSYCPVSCSYRDEVALQVKPPSC